jgi:hypothetical protein
MHFCQVANQWILITILSLRFAEPRQADRQTGPTKSDLELFGLSGTFLAHLAADL